jgi:hypothetical protein
LGNPPTSLFQSLSGGESKDIFPAPSVPCIRNRKTAFADNVLPTHGLRKKGQFFLTRFAIRLPSTAGSGTEKIFWDSLPEEMGRSPKLRRQIPPAFSQAHLDAALGNKSCYLFSQTPAASVPKIVFVF